MLDKQWIPSVNPQFRLQWEEAQDKYVLLYPEGMVKLNGSAGEILRRCDGEKTLAVIISELKVEFPHAVSIADDTYAFVEEARQNQWLNSE
jgi:pyrroloquinoline quinone biosynthesis protein D